jgi:hypothetical protein
MGKNANFKKNSMKTEDKIQQEIVMWYRNTYCLKHHNPRNIIFSVPNDSKNAVEQMRKIATGLYAGVSDLIMIHFGQVYFIELKTDTGKQSEKQKDFQLIVENQGFKYYLIRSLKEFQKIIIEM